MNALTHIAAQVFANQTYSPRLLAVTLNIFRKEQEAARTKVERYVRITVRANGKCHPALLDTVTNDVQIVCSCRNARNGVLASSARKVGDGYALVNCRK